MKFGVVIFPGSNCDQDAIHVFQNVLGQEVVPLWHKQHVLPDFSTEDCIILPGGFSYGDYLRSGAIARLSPIMKAVIEFAEKGGYVIGICNGFQVLCESGLLPGALLRNANQQFICDNVFIKPDNTNNRFTQALSIDRAYKIPIAHAEGRYFADEETLKQLQDHQQILFRYCNAFGSVIDTANPNGSSDSIAGICNRNKNVFGLMPHPERAAERELGNTDGRLLFESFLQLETAPTD